MLDKDAKRHLDEQGFLLLEGVLSDDEVGALRERSLVLAEEDRRAGLDYSYGEGARRVWNLVNKGEIFERAIQHPRVLGAEEYLLGEDLILSSFTVNIIGPHTPAGRLHIDSPLSGLPTPRPGFPLVANSVWFLDDFTVENGATRCVPGSHGRLERMPEDGVTYGDEVQIEGPRGSVIILNGAVWHGSGANHTDRERVGLLGFYSRPVLKPQQDHFKLVSEEVIARASPKLKQLLGFDSVPNINA